MDVRKMLDEAWATRRCVINPVEGRAAEEQVVADAIAEELQLQDAKAAAMRAELERLRAWFEALAAAHAKVGAGDWDRAVAFTQTMLPNVNAALAGDAGEKLLERLRMAEAKAASVDCMRDEVRRVRGLLSALGHEQGPRRTIGALIRACQSLHRAWKKVDLDNDQLGEMVDMAGGIITDTMRVLQRNRIAVRPDWADLPEVVANLVSTLQALLPYAESRAEDLVELGDCENTTKAVQAVAGAKALFRPEEAAHG